MDVSSTPDSDRKSYRKRSPVWEFFNNIEDGIRAQCGLCGCRVQYNSSTTNLLKHLRAKHYEEAATLMSWPLTEAVKEASQIPPETETVDENDTETFISQDFPKLVGIPLRKRSPAWELFDISYDDATTVCCKICGSLFSFNSTTNLIKHLRRQHFEACAEIMGWQRGAENEVKATSDGEGIEKDEDDADRTGVVVLMDATFGDSTRKRSIVWYCFTKIDGTNMSTCKLCSKQLVHGNGSTTCLMKHFRARHPLEFAAASELMSSKTEQDPRMNPPDLELQACDGDDVTPITPRRGIRKRSSLAWDCFTPVHGQKELAACDLCGTILKSDDGSTTALLSHFRTHHAIEHGAAVKRRSAKVLKVEPEDPVSDPDYSPREEATPAVRRGRLPATSSAAKKIKREIVTTGKKSQSPAGTQKSSAESDGGGGTVEEFVPSGRNRTSLAWRCFTKIAGSDFAKCRLCAAHIKSELGSTSGLLNHFIKRHSEQYRVALCSQFKQRTNTTSAVICQHFDQLSLKDFICGFCGRLLRQPPGSFSNLRKHLTSKHPQEFQNIVASAGNAANIKREITSVDDEDFESNDASPETMETANNETHYDSESNTLLTVEEIWRRLCDSRQQEHDTKLLTLRSRLTELKKTMADLRGQMTAVEREIKETEDKRREEVDREKELDKRFQLTASGVEATGDTANGVAAGEQTDDAEIVELPSGCEAVETPIETVLLDVGTGTWIPM